MRLVVDPVKVGEPRPRSIEHEKEEDDGDEPFQETFCTVFHSINW